MLTALNQSVKEFQQGIDAHCCLVNALLERQVAER